MPKKIVAITDMAMVGSGYFYIFTNLMKGLVEKGHTVSVAGLGYMGEPHGFPFSVIPASTLQDSASIINNLIFLQKPDLIIVALDIPLQTQLYETLKGSNIKYIAITPLENGPLLKDWALVLSNMAAVFFISQLGADEAKKAGVTNADHLYIGVDSNLWHPATPTERDNLRAGLGIEKDDFVVLTVADNQERKNLAAGMETIVALKRKLPNRKIKYVIVTREDNPFGWHLRSLAEYYGLQQEYMPFKKGIPSQDLWGLYSVADVYLQPSKAEGLGMPVLEAMGCGVICVGTDTGALHELLSDGRGILVSSVLDIIDVWGNSRRSFINAEEAAQRLYYLATDPTYAFYQGLPALAIIDNALKYVRSRTWNFPVLQVHNKILELFNEPKDQTTEN